MKDEVFRARLKEVADFIEPAPASSPQFRVDADTLHEVRHKDQQIKITKYNNPSLNIKLVTVKTQVRACSLGCGKQVQDQKVHRKLTHYPIKHWMTRCTNCNCFVVDGRRYTNPSMAQQAYFNWYTSRETK